MGCLYLGNQKVTPVVIPKYIGIPREVYNDGVNTIFRQPSTNFTFSFPDGVDVIDDYAMYAAFYVNKKLTSIDFSNIKKIGALGAYYCCPDCTSLENINLSSLTYIGNSGMQRAFASCTKIESVSLGNISYIGNNALNGCFINCDKLTGNISFDYIADAPTSSFYSAFARTKVVSFSATSLVSAGQSTFGFAFQQDTSFSNFDVPLLSTVGKDCFVGAFNGCTSLTTLSFPSLNSNSFGAYTDQFNQMLLGVTGCTVHFPSNLQSVIGSWSDVTSGFGGTNTTVLFDLSATT